MDQTPIFITRYALARLLKEFAQRLGVEESMADAMAQIHMQDSAIPEAWTSFITNNCAGCSKEPGTCSFLNPAPANCAPGTDPVSVRAANAIVIELGKLEYCPTYSPSDV